MRHLIPDCLELDLFQDEWAFLAAAMVKTKSMRPARFPEWLGRSFFLIGYRVFVNYKTLAGRKLRGLYILRSDTDKRFMQISGNLFTHYNYRTVDIEANDDNDIISVSSLRSGLNVRLNQNNSSKDIELPESSPFATWREARRFAGPMPFTFTYQKKEHSVLIIEGKRQSWTPVPALVEHEDVSFFAEMKLTECRLANAFVVKDVPYEWTQGKIEKL